MSTRRAQNALAFAYQYGYPLYEYGRMFKGYEPKTNHLFPGHRLATVDDKNLVRPNVDTIYSTVFYDLSSDDVTLTLPDIQDRYWCVACYDLYGNNFANVSSLQGHPAGKYRLTLDSDETGLNVHGENLGIHSCTAYGLILIRILTTGTEEDMAVVRGIQSSFDLKTTLGVRHAILRKLDTELLWHLVDDVKISQGEAVLQLLAAFAPHNPPSTINDRPWVADMLVKAGIAEKTFQQPANTSIQPAIVQANRAAYSIRGQAGMTEDLGNGWTKGADHILGDYGSYYNARHVTAIRGYLALTAEQSFYPVYTGGNSSGSYSAELGPKEAYMITFSCKPRLKLTGFWSLTMYSEEGYLVPNRLNRHAISDRSELMRDAGAPGHDDSFQVLLQPADLEPPQSWTRSWLPAPAGGGKLSFSLRLYGAEECMRDGTWVYPKVKKVSAIRA